MSLQLDLFAAPEPAPARMTKPHAEARRDLAISRGSRRAGHSWTLEAARYIAYFSACKPEGFLTEDASAAWAAEGRAPAPDNRAWGGAVRVARDRGWIIKAGFRVDQYCSPKTLWKRADAR